MRRLLRVSLLTAAAVLVHVVLGWEWTILAGLAGGLWIGKGGWSLGAVAVGLDWLLLVAYSSAVDARAVGRMTEAVSGVLGNMPSFMVVALTLLIGLLMGGVGGAAGTQLRRVLHARRTPVAV